MVKKKNGKEPELDFEEKLWASANKLRKNMDPAIYKHIVLGLIFLKYVSDAFEERYQQLLSEKDQGANPEDKDEYLGNNIFWIPKIARWNKIQTAAKSPTIGTIIDNAMIAIEKENRILKSVLVKDYARPALDKQSLGTLIDLIGTIGLGDTENKSKDILGRVYEYFLRKFASAEGKNGGQFYTPKSVVRLLVNMIEPYRGRVFDPCCGSGGMFVQSEKFIEQHGGKSRDISIYGQESNETTWHLARMNLALRGIDADIKWNNEGSFLKDEFSKLKADYILANPPFNDKDWSGDKLKEDVRWKDFGVPPENNANFGWVQHFIYHLSPKGVAGFVLANGSLSTQTKEEGPIRTGIIEDDLVDCIVALPDQLFYSTPIPASLWFIRRKKEGKNLKNREKEILFIYAKRMSEPIDRTHVKIPDEDIETISNTYHAWRDEKGSGKYKNIPGFCKSANLDEIKKQQYILAPGRYVGLPPFEQDKESYDSKMTSLSNKLKSQFKTSSELENKIRGSLKELNYNI